MTHLPTALPERKTYYGQLTRVIEPGRHVYQTKLDFAAWGFAVVDSVAACVCVWGGFYIPSGVHYGMDAFVWGMAVLLWIFALLFLYLMVRTLSIRTTLVVSASQVEVRQRSLVFKPSTVRRSSLQAVTGATPKMLMMFGRGGGLVVYGVEIGFANGERELLRTKFESTDQALVAIRDIGASVRQAQEQPELF